MEGIRILHNVPIWYEEAEIALDFHVFEVQDFDVLIGQPVEKLFQIISSSGTLDVTLGDRTFSSSILRSKDYLAEPMPQEEQADEMQTIFPAETPESSLEKDAKLFIQKEDDQEETFELPTFLQKSSQRSLNEEFRENAFATPNPCLETPMEELHVDNDLLEEVKFISLFISSNPIFHLYETEQPPSPSSKIKPCPSGPMFHFESREEENFLYHGPSSDSGIPDRRVHK